MSFGVGYAVGVPNHMLIFSFVIVANEIASLFEVVTRRLFGAAHGASMQGSVT